MGECGKRVKLKPISNAGRGLREKETGTIDDNDLEAVEPVPLAPYPGPGISDSSSHPSHLPELSCDSPLKSGN